MFPGFVDLQVNGYKGIDFSAPNITLEDINAISYELWKKGIIGYCPTIISSPFEVYAHNLPLITEASRSAEGAQILGVHLEGPFLNPNYGPRGIHPEKYIVAPSIELFEQFRKLSEDSLSILTIAPECPGAIELIKHVTSTSKVLVSLGHFDAGREIIQNAVNAGARAATHVGNGLADMLHRHNNPLWPILADDHLTGLFITDGTHLPEEMVRVCLRAKGMSRFIVTSDMVHIAGLTPGEYDFHGVPVVLEPEGVIHRKGVMQHAGSAATMLECMNFLASLKELDEEGLQRVGFKNPLKLINTEIDQERLKLRPGIIFEGGQFRISN